MQVNLKLVPDNIKEVKGKIEKSLKEVGKEVLGIAGGIGGGIQKTLGGVFGALKGGVSGGAAIAGGAAGMAGVVMILKKIHDKIEKGFRRFEEASTAFKGTREIIERMWNIVLRPLGNIIATLVRPYLMLAMRVLQPKLKEMYAVIKEAGGTPGEEDIAKISSIWKEAAVLLGSVFNLMGRLIKPLIADVEGFTGGMKLALNTWLVGLGTFIKSFLEGNRVAVDSLSEELLRLIAEEGVIFSKLPANVRDLLTNWVEDNPDAMEGLPKEIADELKKPLEENTQDLKDLAGWVAFDYWKEMTNDDGKVKLRKLVPDLVAWIKRNVMRSGGREWAGAYGLPTAAVVGQKAGAFDIDEISRKLGRKTEVEMRKLV